MKSQSHNNSRNLSMPMDDVFMSAPIRTTPVLSLVAAVLITGLGLFALSHGSAGIQPSVIDGMRVTNLAPVLVRPTASEMRAAMLDADAETGAAVMTLPHSVETSASLLGAQLAMPYYSFGHTTGNTVSSKE